MNFRKQTVLCVILLLLGQRIPLTVNQVYAETNGSIDEQALTDFRNQIPDYVAMGTTVPSVEEVPTAVQEFSFVEKTFQTVTNQPIILRFTSTHPADEVLVRVPIEGKIMTPHFSSGESVTYSHGEYWTLHTKEKQTEFTLPVVFETAGQYFLTVDHDADHFYLEVEDVSKETEQGIQLSIDLEHTNAKNIQSELAKSKQQEEANNSVKGRDSQIESVIMAKEEYLPISEELIQAEENRILESSVNPQTRQATPRNWSQFRSAWNDRNTSSILLTESISYSSSILGSSLNTRSSSVNITSRPATQARVVLSFSNSNNNLELSGSANLTVSDIAIMGGDDVVPIIKHNGSGLVDISNIAASYSANRTLIHAQNINLSGFFFIYAPRGGPAISLAPNGTLTITPALNVTSSYISSRSGRKPIESDASSRIIINADRLTMAADALTPMSSWYHVNATLTGVNGSQVLISESDPNDFEERYTRLFRASWYSTLIFNGTGGSWVNPPRPSYELSLEASPTLGGNPTAETTTITQGETTTLHANPTETFDFLRWEIVSGTDSMIADETNEVTTFTMGSSDTTVRAVYQKKQGGDVLVKYLDESLAELAETRILRGLLEEDYETEPIEIEGYTLKEMPENAKGRFTKEEQTVTYLYTKDVLDPVSPVDPLAPETEVDPENPPKLPEEQGPLSIDFVSRFSFGQQGISTQTKNYYAQPQRLLNPDGTVNQEEERPNYVQISDRRSENDRHGWTLSVTQNEQFHNDHNHELKGASLQLTNQQVASVQEVGEPELNQPDGIKLIPGEKTELMTAKDTQGIGTWIYRFGDAASADKSVALEVPPSAAPQAATYQTTLSWELSMVPDN